jgi:hypothetical protein
MEALLKAAKMATDPSQSVNFQYLFFMFIPSFETRRH